MEAMTPQAGQPTFGFTSYNLTSRLSSDSMLKLSSKDGVVYKKLSFWIQHEPKAIWNLLYGGKISLTKEAHQKLMTVVKDKYPELYSKKEMKRLRYKKAIEKKICIVPLP